MKSAARRATKVFLVISIIGYIGLIVFSFLFKDQIIKSLPEAFKDIANYVVYIYVGFGAFGIIMSLFSFLALGMSRRGFLISTGIFSLLTNFTVAILLFCIAHYESEVYNPFED